jgi:hypothetical protein
MADPDVGPTRDSQHQGVGRQDGVVWSKRTEALLNVVMSNQRKMLTHWGQQACGQVRVLLGHPAQMMRHRRIGAT